MGLKVNWGCGPVRAAGWIALDRSTEWGVPDVLSDTTVEPLPFCDSEVELLVANHSLQMVTWHDLGRVLREWRRVLSPAGTARILVPDAVGAFRAYLDDRPEWFPVSDDDCPDVGSKLSAYLTWWSEARCCHTFESLVLHLTAAGFEHVQRFEAFQTIGDERIVELDSRAGESLIVEAW